MFSWRKKEESLITMLRAELKGELALHQSWLTDCTLPKLSRELQAYLKPQSEAVRTELTEISEKLGKLLSEVLELKKLADRDFQRMESVLALDKKLKKSVLELKKLRDRDFRQVESLLALHHIIPLKRALPGTRHWSASPDLLLHLYTHIRETRPAVVVELGSGLSTLIMAKALREVGSGRIWSLEHDAEYYGRTHALLVGEGVDELVDLLLAPLVSWRPQRASRLGTEWTWYALPDLVKQLNSVDMLLVDGPPGSACRYSRYPALPEFVGRLHQGSVVLLDDAERKAEKAIAKAWIVECGLAMRRLCGFEKGLAEFRLAVAEPQRL